MAFERDSRVLGGVGKCCGFGLSFVGGENVQSDHFISALSKRCIARLL